jgi:hypothetical protein
MASPILVTGAAGRVGAVVSLQEFVRKNAAAFTASAKAAR